MNGISDPAVFFRKAFEALTERKPFPWQERAFAILAEGNVPTTVSLPTGTGKTSLIQIWLVALAWQAAEGKLLLPRRLVWIVNRRVVVDQATDEAVGMVNRVNNPNIVQEGEHRKMLAQLRNSLASLSFLGGRGSASVVVSTLRGQLADSGKWKFDPTRPAIVIGTVDMIGSRLLFSGYGDGKSKRPLHAGLLGHDSWVVLDEAHLTPAFTELLKGIQASQADFERLAPFYVSFLSATQRGGKDETETIRIEPSDEAHKVIGKRLSANKCLRIHRLNKKDDVVEKIAGLAQAHADARARVLVYVKQPKVVEQVSARLAKEAPDCCVRVLTGTLRGFERDKLADDPVFAGFHSDPKRLLPDVTHYLVSTSAGEVGADLDADHMICDLVAVDSLIQRFGRVNRLGFTNAQIDLVLSAEFAMKFGEYKRITKRIAELESKRKGVNDEKKAKDLSDEVTKEKETLKGISEDPLIATLAYLESLPSRGKKGHDISPSALRKRPPPVEAFTESPPVVPLARHWLDMWSLTSIRDAEWPERPEVAPWLHGAIADLPETWVVWRKDVEWLSRSEVKKEDCAEVFDAYTIRPHEQLREPTYDIRAKLKKLAESRGNETRRAILLRRDGSVAWRGTLAELVTQEADRRLSLNFATVVLVPTVGGLSEAGLFVPTESAATDVADLKGALRKRFLTHQEDGSWRAISIAALGEEGVEFEAGNRQELVDAIAKAMRLNLVASVQIGGRDENEEDSARYLLYFADPVTAAQSSAVSFVSREKQTLSEHSDRVGTLLAGFATRVGLADKTHALGLAGSGHDTGKSRRCWQRAIGNTDFANPLAKSGHARFNTTFNGGYRHEFGSLLDAMSNAKIQTIADEVLRDVVLHSIASHHGYARPHFRDVAFDKKTAYKTCHQVAIEAMQRFGRLQARYGWWGLAWLEALLKAADALVSSGLDQGEPHE